jgi:hypothetical protein
VWVFIEIVSVPIIVALLSQKKFVLLWKSLSLGKVWITKVPDSFRGSTIYKKLK